MERTIGLIYNTRRSAREHDDRYYLTGKPCPKGHTAPRFVSNGGCTQCLSKLAISVQDISTIKTCLQCGATFVGKKCRQCRRRLGAGYASRNRSRLAQLQRKRSEARRQYVRTLKESTPCVDCKQKFPWYVTQFDHLNGRGEGDAMMARLICGGTFARIKRELTKCELVCSNCHAVRTHFRAVEKGQRKP